MTSTTVTSHGDCYRQRWLMAIGHFGSVGELLVAAWTSAASVARAGAFASATDSRRSPGRGRGGAEIAAESEAWPGESAFKKMYRFD